MYKACAFLLLSCVFGGKVFADECFNKSDISNMLKASLEEFCGGFDNTGSSLKLEFDGKIDIKSMGLFKKIAGEIATAADSNVTSKEYKNLERSGLLRDKENTRQCNIVYTKMTMEMFKNRCK